MSNPERDAFSRLRVSNPTTIFSSQAQYDVQPLLWETAVVGSGTAAHLPNESSVRLRTTTTNGDSVVRQSRLYAHYQPGKSQLVMLTGVLGNPAANVRKRIGLFDASNGIYLQQESSGLSLVRRTFTSGSAVNNVVYQTEWNLDRMDGTGSSGFTLDPSKAQILVIDAQWLGVGRVRVGFDIEGDIVYAHEFRNANTLALVYTTTLNLPVRYEITNTGTAASATNDLIQICASVVSEGGVDLDRGFPFTANNGTTAISVTTRRAILSIRPATTFNSITNRSYVILESVGLALDAAAAQNVVWELVYNPTFTGTPTWSAANGSSGIEYSVHGDAAAGAITGGLPLLSGVAIVSNANSFNPVGNLLSRLPLALDIAGTVQIAASLVVTASGATNCLGALNWRELR